MATNEPSTPVKYKETWVVVCDKERYVLTGEQLKILKAATTSGNRGLIWFNKFAISIPHISSIYLESKRPDVQYLNQGKENFLPPQEQRIRIKKIKEKIKTI